MTAAPYTFDATNVGVGTFSYTARATDNLGVTATSGAVTATAADSDGSVTQVQLFQGASLLATLTSAPYTFNWTNVPPGSYVLTAQATDNRGALTTSSAVNVTVNANQAPTVSITVPANNASFVTPATINITASASDSDGTVARVELYEGANLLATLTAPPYTFGWTNVAQGSYTLFAKATDNLGAATTSSAINVTVNPNQPPTVSLTSPNNNATFTAPATITLTASASDTDGTITQVEFLSGNNVIATLTSPPYSFDWTNVGVGGYTLTARATDDKGAQTTSTPVTVTVTAASATIYYIYTDQLNTPRAITNEAATTVWKWDNVDPFGANAPNEDPDGDTNKFVFNLRFPGQYFDRETNTHYNMARDYDPAIGRYVQSDPIGLRGGINTYLYARANSLTYVDPYGEVAPIYWAGLALAWGFYQGMGVVLDLYNAGAAAQQLADAQQLYGATTNACQSTKLPSACGAATDAYAYLWRCGAGASSAGVNLPRSAMPGPSGMGSNPPGPAQSPWYNK
jgi:RHS repeat-associated protein